MISHIVVSIISLITAFFLGQWLAGFTQDELQVGKKYLFIARDASILISLALLGEAFGNIWLQFVIPGVIIISFFWFWKYAEKAYYALGPILAISSALAPPETYITINALCTLCWLIMGTMKTYSAEVHKNSKKIA